MGGDAPPLLIVPDTQIRKQAGNSVPVNVVRAVLESFLPIILGNENSSGMERIGNL